MTYHCGACRSDVQIDSKGACAVCGGSVRAVRPVARPSITLSELPGFGWKARFTDGNGIVHVGRGTTKPEAVFSLFNVCPTELPIEIVEERSDDAV